MSKDSQDPRRISSTMPFGKTPIADEKKPRAIQGRSVGRPLVKPKPVVQKPEPEPEPEPKAELAQAIQISTVQRPKMGQPDRVLQLMRATEERIRRLQEMHKDSEFCLQEEIDALKHALNVEKQAHQNTKNKLGETNNEIDRLNRIAVHAAAEAHDYIARGEETLAESAVSLWQMVIEMYEAMGIDIRTPVTERFQAAAAALGIKVSDEDVETMVSDIFDGLMGDSEDGGLTEDENRVTQVGHEPPGKR